MKVKKRISMLAVIVLLVFLLWFSMEYSMKSDSVSVSNNGEVTELEVWYTDAKMQEYMESAAKSFEDTNNVKINLVLQPEISYIEEINNKSVGEEFEGPDVYLVTNDQLEMVELTGLTKKVQDKKKHYTSEYFCNTALHAVRYNGAQIAYPICFETSFLLYNKDFISLEKTVEAESDGEDIPDQAEVQKVEVIPKTLDELMDFSENVGELEGVENIFRFDVSDIFYTYFFVGEYLELGGLDGDNAGVVDITNPQVKECLTAVQQLAQFFAIDVKTINYETVLTEFAEGKTVYAIGKTDAVERVRAIATRNGKEINFGVAGLPDISEELGTKALSITTAAVVNGYTRREKEADMFADYLAFGYVGKLYETSGKHAAKRGTGAVEENFSKEIYAQYEDSVSLPKLLNASNFWVDLEIAFFNIWTGENVDTEIQKVSDQVTQQLNN